MKPKNNRNTSRSKFSLQAVYTMDQELVHAPLKSVIASINLSWDDLGLHYKEKRKVTK
jgi:hypothetical protein